MHRNIWLYKITDDTTTRPDHKKTMKVSLHVLNLEDDAIDAELNEAMLSARWPDCRFERVDNRTDFLAALEQSDLDVILSDYTMPGFNGRDALALARKKRPEVPFIFVSGTIGEDAAIEALKNGATDYVLKHRLMRLIPVVDRALREHEERAECRWAEESMRESEHKYRELFESLEDAAFLVDEQSKKIIDTNRSAGVLLGCNRAGVLGRPESTFLALDEVRSAGSGLPPTFECNMVRANGTVLPVSVHATHLKLYGRSLVLRLCHELRK